MLTDICVTTKGERTINQTVTLGYFPLVPVFKSR